MNDSTLKIIAVLLTLILAVQLNGAEAVKANLGSAAFVIVAIGAVVLGIRFLWSTLTNASDAFREDQRLTKAEGKAWRWKYLLYPAVAGTVGVVGWAFVAAGFTFKKPYYTNALDGIPYSNAPVFLLIFAFIVGIFESALTWLPKTPGVVLEIFKIFGRTLIAPVTEPRTRWREIEAKRLAGMQIGSVRAAGSIVASFLGGCFVFLIGALILAAVLGNLLWVLGPTIFGAP